MLWRRAVRDARRSAKARAWREDAAEQEALLESIKGVVAEIFTKHNELPFLAMYRKQVALSPCSGLVRGIPAVKLHTPASSCSRGLTILTMMPSSGSCNEHTSAFLYAPVSIHMSDAAIEESGCADILCTDMRSCWMCRCWATCSVVGWRTCLMSSRTTPPDYQQGWAAAWCR